MRKSDEPIIIEQTFNTSIETVWNAITEVDQMRKWFFDNIPSFKPEVGFETQFDVQSGERNFRHMWRVTEVKPMEMIKINWKYEGYPGDSYVIFELFEQNGSILLRLTTQILEDFPDDIPEFKRESCVEGWTFLIKKSLKEYLE